MDSLASQFSEFTPSHNVERSFKNTREALGSLHTSILCRKCSILHKELFTLGQCEHRFCRKCAEENLGKMCPVCDMPSHATQAHVDKQLSNIASLCFQMADLLDSNLVDSKGKDLAQTIDQPPKSSPKIECKRRTQAALFGGNKGHKTRADKKSLCVTESDNKVALPTENKDEEETFSVKAKSGNKKVLEENLKSGTYNNSLYIPASTKKLQKKTSEKLSSNSTTPKTPDLQPNSGLRKRGRKSGQSSNLPTPESKVGELASVSTPKCGRRPGVEKMTTSSAKKGKSQSHLTKRNAKGETSLQVATIKADVQTVKQLLEDGANPNVRDNAGWTPLHEAVNHGCLQIAELLINHGASVNAPGLDNDTPLHDAVSNYRLDCVQLLVCRGANTLARNIHGRQPLDLAQTDEMREVLLASTGAQSSSADIKDMSVGNAKCQLIGKKMKKDRKLDERRTILKITEEDDQIQLCFLGTALSREQQALLDKCAKVLSGKIVDNFSPEVSHLITGVNAEGMCPRTLNYLNVILAGKWVVNTEWLKLCVEYGTRVSEETFEIPGCSTNPSTLAPQKGRLNRLRQLPGLFDGCQFYFYGKFDYPTPSREDLANLCKQGGGIILTREPRLFSLDDYPYTIPFHASSTCSLADCAIFVVYDDSCPNPPHVNAQRMSCLPVSWLMDSIASFSILEKTDYLKH